jgi:hypothetical protein
MKAFFTLLLLSFIFFNSQCEAQWMLYKFSIALTPTGVLLGKHIKGHQTYNTINDTVSLADVKNIYAINVIYIDRADEIQKVKVTAFEMAIANEKDTIHLKIASDQLSEEMKGLIQKLKPGQLLAFENIFLEFPDGSNSFASPLFFV